MTERRKRPINHLARRDPEMQARITQILPPERYSHQMTRNGLLSVLEPLVTNTQQINNELAPIIEEEPIPKYSARNRLAFVERFQLISAAIEEAESPSAIMTLTSPNVLTTIIGISSYSLLHPEDVYHVLQFSRLGIADDFSFTGTLEKDGAPGIGVMPGVQISRDNYVLMRPQRVARQQGVKGPFPPESGYRFIQPRERSIASDMFVPGATKLTPIPPDYFRFFAADPQAPMRVNQKFAERTLTSDLQSHVSNEILALDKIFGLLEYLHTIREGFLRIQFLDALITERGPNWVSDPPADS